MVATVQYNGLNQVKRYPLNLSTLANYFASNTTLHGTGTKTFFMFSPTNLISPPSPDRSIILVSFARITNPTLSDPTYWYGIYPYVGPYLVDGAKSSYVDTTDNVGGVPAITKTITMTKIRSANTSTGALGSGYDLGVFYQTLQSAANPNDPPITIEFPSAVNVDAMGQAYISFYNNTLESDIDIVNYKSYQGLDDNIASATINYKAGNLLVVYSVMRNTLGVTGNIDWSDQIKYAYSSRYATRTYNYSSSTSPNRYLRDSTGAVYSQSIILIQLNDDYPNFVFSPKWTGGVAVSSSTQYTTAVQFKGNY